MPKFELDIFHRLLILLQTDLLLIFVNLKLPGTATTSLVTKSLKL